VILIRPPEFFPERGCDMRIKYLFFGAFVLLLAFVLSGCTAGYYNTGGGDEDIPYDSAQGWWIEPVWSGGCIGCGIIISPGFFTFDRVVVVNNFHRYKGSHRDHFIHYAQREGVGHSGGGHRQGMQQGHRDVPQRQPQINAPRPAPNIPRPSPPPQRQPEPQRVPGGRR